MNDSTTRRATSRPRNTAAAGHIEFLKGFLRNPAQVGSVIPSSHQLEQRLVDRAGVRDARTVVELGPGTGGTTRAFLDALPPGATLLGIEVDPGFHRHLRSSIADSRFILQQGSAEDIDEYLRLHGLAPPEAIVSGIPFSTLPTDACDRIAMRIAQVLRPGGRFVAYQVRAHVAGYMSRYLGSPALEWEYRNVPPVRVFTWVKRAA